MWWIWIALLIEAVGLLLVWLLVLMAAPKSEEELRYEEEAQVRALAHWRASGCHGWVATKSPTRGSSRRPWQPQDIGQLVDSSRSQGRRTRIDLVVIGSPFRALIRPTG
jgi:hypothetical protein